MKTKHGSKFPVKEKPAEIFPYRLYRDFGLVGYATQAVLKGNQDRLDQLDRIVSKYILLRALEDLPETSLDVLEKKKFKDSSELYTFLDKNIANFPVRLKQYGRDFNRKFTSK